MPVHHAPILAAGADLIRFKCVNCHIRDGAGGLRPELVDSLRQISTAEAAESLQPPTLTAVGQKLRSSTMHAVLAQGSRARPWMSLRMPQFGKPNVEHLVHGFAAMEGMEADDSMHQVPLTPELVQAGRQLVGKSGFGCISCHDIAGIPNSGTRGPDLATTTRRVRHDWYLRWLEQPQRLEPGTRMPTVFPDGKSLLPGVLGGDAERQSNAMWAYLTLGESVPIPDGLEPPKGLALAASGRPTVLRTFMPELGTHAVAVGYPDGISVAFDGTSCTLAYAWNGRFLDASPIWNNRGGTPAILLGKKFWNAPSGCPLEVSLSDLIPDFVSRARHVDYGGVHGEGLSVATPSRLKMQGYSLDLGGSPSFQYLVNVGEKNQFAVTERPTPTPSPFGPGITRSFTIVSKEPGIPWLLAAQAVKQPKVISRTGEEIAFPLGLKEVKARDTKVVVSDRDGRQSLLEILDATSKDAWVFQLVDARWQVLAKFAMLKPDQPFKASLRLLVLPKDDLQLLKHLATSSSHESNP